MYKHPHSVRLGISLAPNFVVAGFCVLPAVAQISNPLGANVARFFPHFEKADAQPGRREHGDLEVQRDWWLVPRFAVRQGGDQLHLRRQGEFVQSLEPLDLPHERLLRGDVLGLPPRDLDRRLGRVFGNWDAHDDAHGELLVAEAGSNPNVDFHAGSTQLLDDGHHLEWEANTLCDAVLHELELAVGGRERNGLLPVKLAKVDALMELKIG
mmetsp:Transcript_37470/g.93141  ORF Transcript_37470/g.93141 Transcript_37470/m.93141 type:complete len:211 (+) Transcript_37470:108-740(+)